MRRTCQSQHPPAHRILGRRAAVGLLLVLMQIVAQRASGEPARAGTDKSPPGGVPLFGSLTFTSNREPIAVTADAMEFDYRTRVLTYHGSVVVTQGDMKLESDRLTVTLDEQGQNRIKGVVADGQVRLAKGSRWATGGHATFDQVQNTVILSDKAELHDGPNQVHGDRIVGYLNEERFVVEGGGDGRVTALLIPAKNDATPTAAVGTP